jgi:hypothetical protein
VTNDDPSEGKNLEEGTREANSNLQRLIDAVGGLLAASGDLLLRLQQILSGAQPAPSGSNGSDDAGASPPADPRDG